MTLWDALGPVAVAAGVALLCCILLLLAERKGWL